MPTFVFFGTSDFSVIILEKLKENGFIPSLIITPEDKPKGRKLVLTPPPVKLWAKQNKISFLQPSNLKDEIVLNALKKSEFDLFIVCSYGKIIPQNILDIPRHGTLNVHPSLLPKLRGPSPIQSAILNEENTGVTIMLLDAEIDHGAIISQEEVQVANWPPYAKDLEITLAEAGGILLAKTIPSWISGQIKEIPQNHSKATFTKKIAKEDALIKLDDDPNINLRKIHAYAGWPNAFTYFKQGGKELRVIIKTAHIENGKLALEKVVPEGKKEIDFEEFKKALLA